jgi:hypothetical protein
VYTIYHIEGVKIGCTKLNPKVRVKQQGYSVFQVLEVHEDIQVASKRESDLQIQYGYTKDAIPYYRMVNVPTHEGRSKGGKITGKKSVENGHMSRMGKIGGKINGPIQGKKNAESGQVGEAGKIGGKIGGKITGPINIKKVNNIERTCPYCSKTIKGPVYLRFHGQKCKLVPVTT